MLSVILLSIILFLIALLFGCLCNLFVINPYVLFILPIIGVTIVAIIMEKVLTNKTNVDNQLYNVITLQVPAILGVLIALTLWFMIKNEIIIRSFYYTSKYLYVPVLVIRFIYEIFKSRNKNILVSSGFVIGMIIGLSIIL